MSVIQYLKYNNYANRIVKVESSYADYVSASSGNMVQLEANFNPGDGLWTKHVCGKYQDASNPTEQTFDFDYLVVYSDDTYYTIVSRWFIIKPTRLRGGQWDLILKRDVIADKYDDTIDAPAIIERAMVDEDNPLIYNKENFSYNQIKKHEYKLKDETRCPWAVAYLPLNITPGTVTVDSTVADGAIELSQLPVAAGTYRKPMTMKYYMQWRNGLTGVNYYETMVNGTSPNTSTGAATGGSVHTTLETSTIVDKDAQGFGIYGMLSGFGLINLNDEASKFLTTLIDDVISLDDYSKVYNYRGQIIKVSGNYYKVEITNLGRDDRIISKKLGTSQLLTDLNTAIAASGLFDSAHNAMDDETFTIQCSTERVVIRYIDMTNEYGSTYTLSNSMPNNNSGLYKIVAFPLGELQIYKNNATDVKCDYNIQRQAVIALGAAYSSQIYDIQLLPYCPVRNLIKNGKLDLGSSSNYTYITKGGNNVGILFYVTESDISFNIYNLEDENGNIVAISDVLKMDQAERYNVAYPTYNHYGILFNKPYILYNEGLNFLQDEDLAPIFEYCSWAMITCPDNGIKIEKIKISTGEILQTYHTDQISVDLEYMDITRLLLSNIDLGTIYTDWDDYNASNYRLVISFESTPSYEAEDDSISPYYVEKLWEKLLWDMTYLPEPSNISVKVDSECTFERLVSPNYQGVFEFCIAKNGGAVSLFNVDMTLKPYNPYLHLNPDFGGLYGTDFNDARGLICNGDFSFGQLTDAFRTYELQNKNYQAMFDRNIESMDVLHKIDRAEAIIGALVGNVGGAVSGAMTGALVGGPAGAAAGAILGGTASTVGGIADLVNMERRYDERKSLAIDQHNFQLDNIKALPYSLTKCPALTYNNKIFPFVELYDCTDEEKSALREFLAYRSFNVGVMGTIREYQKTERTFIKGQIIRIDSITAPANVALEIIEEINKGVYI